MTDVGPILEARGVVKRFGPLVANDVATFVVYSGEVVALLGENGAGKSTLCKILFGYYRADAGEVRVAGRPVTITSPREARRLGIGMVFQNFSLIPALTVWENVALFVEDLPWVIRPAAVIRRMRADAERLHLRVDPRLPVGRLAVGDRQKVEILKQLLGGARVLILDEPTKVLAPQEVEGLFRTLAALRNDGYAIIFISHKLHEAMACADRIAVMRQGRIVATLRAHEASEATLLGLMFVDSSASSEPPAPSPPGEIVLERASFSRGTKRNAEIASNTPPPTHSANTIRRLLVSRRSICPASAKKSFPEVNKSKTFRRSRSLCQALRSRWPVSKV